MNHTTSTTPDDLATVCPTRRIGIELPLATIEELDHLATLSHISRQETLRQILNAALLSDTPHWPIGSPQPRRHHSPRRPWRTCSAPCRCSEARNIKRRTERHSNSLAGAGGLSLGCPPSDRSTPSRTRDKRPGRPPIWSHHRQAPESPAPRFTVAGDASAALAQKRSGGRDA